MKVRELAEEILRQIERGELDPEATVVRPFCLCDSENGYVEAHYLDQIVRRYEDSEPVEFEGEISVTRMFKHGNVEPGPFTEKTLKLG